MRPREDWEKFPIVIDGVGENEIGQVNLFADAVARWTGFIPYAGQNWDWAAKASFNWDLYTKYIDNAKAAGLRLIWGLSWSAPNLQDLGNDGRIVIHVNGDPWEMWTKSMPSVRIPVGFGAEVIQPQITKDFVDHYWSARANVFIPAAVQYSDQNGDVLWGWRVIEEPKYDAYGVDTDVYLSKKMRDLTNLHDNGRFRFTYAGANYMPNADLLWTLVENGHSKHYELDPPDPVARVADDMEAMGVGDFYDQKYGKQGLDVRLSGALRQVQMFDHVWSGAYMESMRDWAGGLNLPDQNRIWVYHRIRLGREALVNLARVYTDTFEKPPDHILFHAPGLLGKYQNTAMTAEHARHDLWVGVHEAGGICLYSFAYRGLHPLAWPEYRDALTLIKQTIRPYIIDGVKSHPNNAFLTPIPADSYISIVGHKGNHIALPNGAQQYTAINLTLFRKANIGYLIATNSTFTAQPRPLNVTLDDPITNVEVVSGMGNPVVMNNNTLTDAFSGIDGRVYKITFG